MNREETLMNLHLPVKDFASIMRLFQKEYKL